MGLSSIIYIISNRSKTTRAKKNHAKVEHPTANFPVKEKFPKERRLPFKKRKENL